MNTPALEALRAFRHQVYPLLGCRRDALFELLDAVLSAPTIETPAHLSLVPTCQRGWGSLYDALNAGTLDEEQIERLIASYPLVSDRAWYAVDASVWPRCDAETSPARGYYAHPYRHSHGQAMVAGWNYSWLVHVPSRCASWTAPLRVRRLTPGENMNVVAAEQIRSWVQQAPPTAADGLPPIFSFDAGYDSVPLPLALADVPVGLLVRLRAGRYFWPIRRRSRRPAARGAMGPSSSAPRRRRGPSRPTSGRATPPAMGASPCRRGMGCIRSRNSMRPVARVAPDRSCGES